MLLIPCPHCGPRNSADLRYLGEVVGRPDPSATTPAEWRDHLYLRDNGAGWHHEQWFCRSGCGRYFTVERHTRTGEIRAHDPATGPGR